MDNNLKDLEAAFKQVSADVKKCRAGQQALVQLASFNGAGDAMALTIHELEAAAEQFDLQLAALRVEASIVRPGRRVCR